MACTESKDNGCLAGYGIIIVKILHCILLFVSQLDYGIIVAVFSFTLYSDLYLGDVRKSLSTTILISFFSINICLLSITL